MRDLLRILSRFWRASLAAELEYRVNFVFSTLNAALGLVLGLFALSLFFQNGHAFDGWSFDASLVVYGLFTTFSGISSVLFVPNLSRVVEHVDKGTMDFVLLKPVDSQLFVSTRNFSPWGLPDIALGLGVIGYAARRLDVDPGHVPAALLAALLSLIILYSLWFALASTSIWFVKVYNATEVLRGLLDAGRLPIAAYPAGYRVFFTYVVPVAFLTSVPADVLRGADATSWLAIEVVVAVLAFGLSRAFWRLSLRSYTSASS